MTGSIVVFSSRRSHSPKKINWNVNWKKKEIKQFWAFFFFLRRDYNKCPSHFSSRGIPLFKYVARSFDSFVFPMETSSFPKQAPVSRTGSIQCFFLQFDLVWFELRRFQNLAWSRFPFLLIFEYFLFLFRFRFDETFFYFWEFPGSCAVKSLGFRSVRSDLWDFQLVALTTPPVNFKTIGSASREERRQHHHGQLIIWFIFG